MLVIGHRGAAGARPENTLSAIGYALNLGVDGVEVDVRLLEDTLILLHDDHVDRTTNGSGHYKNMALADLRALDAGDGNRIPVLGEAIAAIDGRIALNVEIKEPGIANAVIDMLNEATWDRPLWRERLLLSSFDTDTTAALAERCAPMRLGVLYEGDFDQALARAARLGACSMHLPLEGLSPEHVQRVHGLGLKALVYTVDADEDLARCASCAVDGVFTDHPQRVIAFNRANSMINI